MQFGTLLRLVPTLTISGVLLRGKRDVQPRCLSHGHSYMLRTLYPSVVLVVNQRNNARVWPCLARAQLFPPLQYDQYLRRAVRIRLLRLHAVIA